MKNIILLGLTSLFTDISSEMVYPLIGLYLASLGTPFTLIGIIEGIAESIANLLKIFSGQLSDRLKFRKPFVIFGYSASSVGKVLLYLSNSWLTVFFGRTIDRFGKGVRTAPRDALIAESTEDKKKGKVFGLHRMMDTFGAMVGVIIVYLVLLYSQNEIKFKTIFLFSLIPAILAVVILFFVKEKRTTVKFQNNKVVKLNFAEYKYLPKKIKYYIVISVLFSLGNSSNQFLLLKSKYVGFSYVNTILLYLFYNISYTLFSYPAGIVGDKIGKKKVIILGYFLYSVVYLMFAFVNKNTAGLLWITFLFYGIYIALVEGQEKAFIVEIVPPQYKASVLGLHYTLTGFMLFPASFIAGFLWDKFGVVVPFLFGSIVSLTSAILMLFLI